MKKLEDNAEYDSTNWIAAMEKATVWGDEIPIGKFYETTDIPTLEETEPVLEARANDQPRAAHPGRCGEEVHRRADVVAEIPSRDTQTTNLSMWIPLYCCLGL